MSWPCYEVEYVAQNPQVPIPGRENVFWTALYCVQGNADLIPFEKLKVGAIWRHPKRGICVKLPGYSYGTIWAMEEEGSPGNHWKVTGEFPNVSATPSINCVGRYHGWVTNGVVTDDCEGRKFDDFGEQL